MLKRHLDRVYALCSQCAAGVAAELERKHKVIEHMSIAKRIAESAKNNIRKVRPTLSSLHCNLPSRALAVPLQMRTSKQMFRSFNKSRQVYRVLSLVLLLAVFAGTISYALVVHTSALCSLPPISTRTTLREDVCGK